MSSYLMEQLAFIRHVTLKAIEDVTEEQADQVPTGFSNSIRWNLGHIAFVQEYFLFHATNEATDLPQTYATLFGPGTKPTDWTEEPPSLDELKKQLTDQKDRIKKTFATRLNETIEEPIQIASLQLSTVEQLISFSLYHEGVHTETIKRLKNFTTI
ncbi:DinB family protein [Texcoconibacillus texcoconensis]|uniref:Putative damage-inducible protein DinB n=1 Tax=Texcoconibacillus texcoconensis TaxID=1095777 RepID=A0A840QS39_9BACI|nr:DinB family protein [Texcoconibacillus texcoconensis]MBB5174149.1 putative damage-inducible protein DinB [Texcoconibacillus texcoconensis]